MKKLVSYQCGTCGAIWDTEEQAYACERGHAAVSANDEIVLEFPTARTVVPERISVILVADSRGMPEITATYVLQDKTLLGWRTDNINSLPPIGTEIIYEYTHVYYGVSGHRATDKYRFPAKITAYLPPEQCDDCDGLWFYPVEVTIADNLPEGLPYHVSETAKGSKHLIGCIFSEHKLQWWYPHEVATEEVNK